MTEKHCLTCKHCSPQFGKFCPHIAQNEPAECPHWEPSLVVKLAKAGAENEPDMVNSPSHYTVGGIETIDYIKAKTQGMSGYEGYLFGNIIKYASRYRYKNGLEDLQKAEWYLHKLMDYVREGEQG